MTHDSPLKPETLAARGIGTADPATGGVVPPIQPATTFERGADYALVNPLHGYARDEGPTVLPAERLLAELEGAEEALLFGSGTAAGMAVVEALQPGDRIVAPKVMYWGLRNRMQSFADTWGLELALFDQSEEGALAACVAEKPTRLIWLETPTNPTWDVIDIAEAAKVAQAAGAVLAVDSTVATPVLTRPLELGADIVMHSATKYLNGHSDVLAGALAVRRKDAFWEKVRLQRAGMGGVLGAFEAWLLQRGLRTLFLRVRRASDTALAVARHFDSDPRVAAVLYPGLQSHPGHAVAARQMEGGFGGMLSLRVAARGQESGGEAALATVKACRVFHRATSLGGVESLIEHRATIEGPSSPVPADLLRLSIGIEAPEDLIADLDQALG